MDNWRELNTYNLKGENVQIIQDSQGGVHPAVYCGWAKRWRHPIEHSIEYEDAVLWQPLPEPRKCK